MLAGLFIDDVIMFGKRTDTWATAQPNNRRVAITDSFVLNESSLAIPTRAI